MESIKRYSPVKFAQHPARTEMRNGWEVVLQYEDETTGPFLIDLSHIGKWDVQGENLSSIRPAGIIIPEDSELCTLTESFFVNLVKWNWATIWHFSQDMPDFASDFTFTNVTEAYALFALMGREVFSIMEKVSTLDLFSPKRIPPFLTMGPVLHVRSQVVVLAREGHSSAVLVACPRGYGQSMADALLDEGKEWGLRPGGEYIFTNMIALMSNKT
ncbi:MAG: sarcosine oxidase subunit gamma SoxG [Thermodesulfobacteriota bacterium]|nr:sarcosine oxidase subunit gamma SoxG [Thermodesulfobacteriota bacterium]